MSCEFLNELNEDQRVAAETTEGPLLILAGAGSGKTKTLVARTANIIVSGKAEPHEILALTFTNKAAREMRERAKSMIMKVTGSVVDPQFFTFHSWGYKFLKSLDPLYLESERLKPGFTIAMDGEQQKAIKDVLLKIFSSIKRQEAKPSQWIPLFSELEYAGADWRSESSILHLLSDFDASKKIDEAIVQLFGGSFMNVFLSSFSFNIPPEIPEGAPEEIKRRYFIIRSVFEVFKEYKLALRSRNLVDFEDLISIPYRVLKSNPPLREWVRGRYKYIMVDEFQDTNGSQMRLIMEIMNPETKNICVVGDDFQSIYGWRGADIQNILNFQYLFEEGECKVVNLKINYRSGKKIVQLGNSMIEMASVKHELKELLVPNAKEDGGIYFRFFEQKNPMDYNPGAREVSFVCENISRLIRQGVPPEEIAVLFRTNGFARIVEPELIKLGVRYKIYGAKTLLEHKFTQSVISYARAYKNMKKSDILYILEAFDIVTSAALGKISKSLGEDDGLKELSDLGDSFVRGEERKRKLEIFLSRSMEAENIDDYGEFLEFLKDNSWIREFIDMDIQSEAEAKAKAAGSNIKKLESLVELLGKYSGIEDFLEKVYLEEHDEERDEGKVSLMSIHKSKGLEFHTVFVIGACDNILPHRNSKEDPERLQEEMRLAYVAFTRAKRNLVVTCSSHYSFPGVYHERLRPTPFFNKNVISKKC